jgi:hypothetical protein
LKESTTIIRFAPAGAVDRARLAEGLLTASAEPNRPHRGELIGDSILPLGSRGIYYITTVILRLAASGAVDSSETPETSGEMQSDSTS